MGFQAVNGLEADVTYALGKKDKNTGKMAPNSVEGYYIGSRTVQNKLGDSQLHIFQTPKGNVGVWGGTDMNRKLSQVTPGTMTRVSANGKKSTPRGDMNVFKVEVDNEQTIEIALNVGSANPHTGSSVDSLAISDDGYDENGYNAESGEYADDEDTSFEPEFVAARTKSAAPTAQKVQDLLNKRSAAKK